MGERRRRLAARHRARPTSDEYLLGSDQPEVIIEYDDEDFYVIFDGRKIAKRGRQAKTWIALDPGYRVEWEPGDWTQALVVIREGGQ